MTESSILYKLAESRVAANVLLILMLLAGLWGLSKINTQFFPSFELERLSIITTWPGANSADVERSLTKVLEEEIKEVDHLKKITSVSSLGVSVVLLEFAEGTEMLEAQDDVKQKIAEIDNLPQEANDSVVQRLVNYELIAQIVIASDRLPLIDLMKIAGDIKAELTELGVDKILYQGYPTLEMAIDIDPDLLQRHGLTLETVSQQVQNHSLDMPIGSASEESVRREIRAIQQSRRAIDYQSIPLFIDQTQTMALGEIADIKLRPTENSAEVWQGEKRAIVLQASRLERGSTLEAAAILKQWEAENLPSYTSLVDVQVFDHRWKSLEQRIDVLLNNGLGGLFLVVLVLLIFLNLRVAIWVAVGIPASLMLTMGVFYTIGGSINMLSLFAFIMTLGIIVDDAIVVGEHSAYQYEQGKDPLSASLLGIKRMFFPVVASSLTTIAAFIPLTMLSGVMGKFLITIPIVVICVIIASLLESFCVLPGHLHHAFKKMQRQKHKVSKIRSRIDHAINHFREQFFRPFVTQCLHHRLTTILFVTVCFLIGLSSLHFNRVGFVFFPQIESRRIDLQVQFIAGTPRKTVAQFLQLADQALQETNDLLGGDLVLTSLQKIGIAALSQQTSDSSENVGSFFVEMTDPDQRQVTNREFVSTWRKQIPAFPGIESLEIASSLSGPGGKNISVQLFSKDIDRLKQASTALTDAVRNLPGTSNVNNDLSYGKDQLVLRLTPLAIGLDVSLNDISRQIRHAYTGLVTQIFTQDSNEIEVRIRIPAQLREQLSTLDNLQISLANGELAPLPNLVTWEHQKGFDSIRHYNTYTSVNVFADLDSEQATLSDVLPVLTETIFPKIKQDYGVDLKLEGSAERQGEAFSDLTTGAAIGLVLIYIILVWVFASWTIPVVVLSIIPLGLFGAIVGHDFMNINLNILSLLGLFGLSGIVINDSIVLVSTYQWLRKQGIAVEEALIETSCLRLRAVLLTSITTICGLIPLLFETSLQAQFLIPMATTIAFGLAFATGVVLILIPVLLSIYESIARRLSAPESVG